MAYWKVAAVEEFNLLFPSRWVARLTGPGRYEENIEIKLFMLVMFDELSVELQFCGILGTLYHIGLGFGLVPAGNKL